MLPGVNRLDQPFGPEAVEHVTDRGASCRERPARRDVARGKVIQGDPPWAGEHSVEHTALKWGHHGFAFSPITGGAPAATSSFCSS
jgi:hypothetical protein